jgi:hypothetical protein
MLFKIFSPKNSAKKIACSTQNKAKLCKVLIITLVFEKSANFFVQNCRKLKRILIITSTPDQYCSVAFLCPVSFTKSFRPGNNGFQKYLCHNIGYFDSNYSYLDTKNYQNFRELAFFFPQKILIITLAPFVTRCSPDRQIKINFRIALSAELPPRCSLKQAYVHVAFNSAFLTPELIHTEYIYYMFHLSKRV